MKKQIRNGVWETNSSAQHTLQVSKKGQQKCRLKIYDDGYVHISLDQEFGKDDNVFTTQKDKLKYIVTWIYTYYNFDFEKIEEGYLWCEFNKKFAEYVNKDRDDNLCRGIWVDKIKYEDAWQYWDHQIYSGNVFDDGCVVDIWNAEQCVDFIFNGYISLVTGCD